MRGNGGGVPDSQCIEGAAESQFAAAAYCFVFYFLVTISRILTAF